MKKTRKKVRKKVAKRIASLTKVPKNSSALAHAQRVTEKASYLGFDWPMPEQVWDKVTEEFGELKTAIASKDKSRVREEMGDLLFSLVNLCRFVDLEAEVALHQATERFLKRFAHVKTRVRELGKTLNETSLEEMDAFWEEAKQKDRYP